MMGQNVEHGHNHAGHVIASLNTCASTSLLTAVHHPSIEETSGECRHRAAQKCRLKHWRRVEGFVCFEMERSVNKILDIFRFL